jgi:hypothetical protein
VTLSGEFHLRCPAVDSAAKKRNRSGDLGKCDSEQARAEQHEARHGYREEPIGYEVMFAHGRAPLARPSNGSRQMHER